MNEYIVVDYQMLQDICKRLEELSEQVQGVHQKLNEQNEVLRGGSYLSEASPRYFTDMEDYLARLKRLHEALSFSSQVSCDICTIMQEAEEQAKSLIPTN